MAEYIDAIEPVAIPNELRARPDDPLPNDLHTAYRGLVGKLQWTQACGNPVIAFDVSMQASKNQAPTVADLLTLNK
eukprot:11829522-Alexandrium_andersonii.AAC.1